MKSLHLVAGLPFSNSAPGGPAAERRGLFFQSRLWSGHWNFWRIFLGIFLVGFFEVEGIAWAGPCAGPLCSMSTQLNSSCQSRNPASSCAGGKGRLVPTSSCQSENLMDPLKPIQSSMYKCEGKDKDKARPKPKSDAEKQKEAAQEDRKKREANKQAAEERKRPAQEARLAKGGFDKNAPAPASKGGALGASSSSSLSSSTRSSTLSPGSTTSATSTNSLNTLRSSLGGPDAINRAGAGLSRMEASQAPQTSAAKASTLPRTASPPYESVRSPGSVSGSAGAGGYTSRFNAGSMNITDTVKYNTSPARLSPTESTSQGSSSYGREGRTNIVRNDPWAAQRSGATAGSTTTPSTTANPAPRSGSATWSAGTAYRGGLPITGGSTALPALAPAQAIANAQAAAGGGAGGGLAGGRAGTNPTDNPNYRNSGDYRGEGTSDPCSLSARVDGKYACAGTVQFGQTAQMMNMTTMMMGSSVAQSAGQSAQMNVLNSGSSQKEALENSANASETTGKVQGAIGLANAAMSVMLLKKGSDHTGFAGEIKTGAGQVTAQSGTTNNNTADYRAPNAEGRLDDSRSNVGSKIVTNFGFNETAQVTKVDPLPANATAAERTRYDQQVRERQMENQQHLEWGKSQARRIANEADSEQKIVSQTAKMQGFMGAMIAGQQIMGAAAAMKNAANMRASAAKLGEQTNNAPFIKPDAMPGNMADGVQSGGSPDLITGSGDNPNAAPADSTEAPSGDNGDLGQGFNPNPLPSDIAPPPTAGKFAGGKPESGGGGGQAPVGGGSTSAANSTPEETQAKPVANQGSEKYESGGTFSGAGGGGKGAEGGPDLNSLLGQLLPKDKDAEKKPDSILKFGGQGPGGQQGDLVLNQGANLFGEISKEYAIQAQKGHVSAD